MKLLIAPDSFKGSLPAEDVASAIADGWCRERFGDDVVRLPMGDGGEGTLDAIQSAVPDCRRRTVVGVTGPSGAPVDAEFIEMPDRTAVIELASSSGLPLMSQLAPLSATSRGLGQVAAAALEAGAERLVIALGGSASTDGGLGALRALGLEALDRHGLPIPDGGLGLTRIAHINTQRLLPPPKGGVEALTDVDNPLLGPRGAATVFGPQKGADHGEIAELESGLAHLARMSRGDPDAPGAGAAGGAAYGLATFWGASLRLGSQAVAQLVGLDEAISRADLVVTGEGALDATSLSGKVVGHVLSLARARGTAVVVIAGSADLLIGDQLTETISLTELAGSKQEAIAHAPHWLREAGSQLSKRYM